MWNQDHDIVNSDARAVRHEPDGDSCRRGCGGTVHAGCDYQFAVTAVVGVCCATTSSLSSVVQSGCDALHRAPRRCANSAGRWPGRLQRSSPSCSASYPAATPSPASARPSAGTRHSGLGAKRSSPAPAPPWRSSLVLASSPTLRLSARTVLPGLALADRVPASPIRSPSAFRCSLPTACRGPCDRAEKEVQTIRSDLVYRFNFGAAPTCQSDRRVAAQTESPGHRSGAFSCVPHSVKAARLFSVERMPRS